MCITDGFWKDRCMEETSISELEIDGFEMTPVEFNILFPVPVFGFATSLCAHTYTPPY